MAISIASTSGVVEYGVRHYVLDSKQDLDKLRTTDKMGSTAYIIADQEWFILSGEKKWEPYKPCSGGGGDEGGDVDPDLDIATQEEVNEMIDDVFDENDPNNQTPNPQNGQGDDLNIATEQEINEMLGDVFK